MARHVASVSSWRMAAGLMTIGHLPLGRAGGAQGYEVLATGTASTLMSLSETARSRAALLASPFVGDAADGAQQEGQQVERHGPAPTPVHSPLDRFVQEVVSGRRAH